MSAPIAEIPPRVPRRAPKKPPASLSLVIIIGLVLGALDMVLMLALPVQYFPGIGRFWEYVLFSGVMLLLYFLPLLLLWHGANWARWLVIALSVLGFASSFMTDDSVKLPLIREIMNWLYVPYYLALIVFLLTPAMRQHFTGKPVETSQESA